MTDTLNNISTKAVQKATGKGWNEWIALLDTLGAEGMPHKDITRMLYDKKYIESSWWCQMVTVGYEYAKGRRIKGQTETAGFEIGVQKMLPASPRRVWKLINSPKGKALWVGDAETEIRTVKENERIRLLWKTKGRKTPTTLQISLFCPRNTADKTNVRFHQEKLSGVAERERMRKHWQKTLQQLSHML